MTKQNKSPDITQDDLNTFLRAVPSKFNELSFLEKHAYAQNQCRIYDAAKAYLEQQLANTPHPTDRLSRGEQERRQKALKAFEFGYKHKALICNLSDEDYNTIRAALSQTIE